MWYHFKKQKWNRILHIGSYVWTGWFGCNLLCVVILRIQSLEHTDSILRDLQLTSHTVNHASSGTIQHTLTSNLWWGLVLSKQNGRGSVQRGFPSCGTTFLTPNSYSLVLWMIPWFFSPDFSRYVVTTDSCNASSFHSDVPFHSVACFLSLSLDKITTVCSMCIFVFSQHIL